MKRLIFLCTPEQLKEPAKHTEGAGELLTGYLSLWHPNLLAEAEEAPQTQDLHELPTGSDLVVGVRQADFDAAPKILRGDLEQISGTLLLVRPEHVDLVGPEKLLEPFAFPVLDQDLVHDFFALGYAYLGLNQLFESMGHDNPLDEEDFWSAVHESATAWTSNDLETARTKLRASFDLLLAARQMVYPATIFLVDLGLCYPGAGGPTFRRRLYNDAPLNLVLTGSELETIVPDEELLTALRRALDEHRVDIVGGVLDDRPLALLPHESRLWSMRQAAELYNKHLVHEVTCFGARHATLMPELPQFLMKFHHRYALHAAYDGSTYPHFKNPKLHWTAADGSVIEALARAARDASSPSGTWTFFEELGRTTMNDRAATVVVAHWVHASAPWYDYLLRVNAYVPLFGTFHRFSDYFTNSTMADHPTNTRVDEYHSQALANGVFKGEKDPVGRWTGHYELRGRLDSAKTLASLATIAEALPIEEAVETCAKLESEVETGVEGVREKIEHFERVTFDKLSAVTLAGSPAGEGILIYNTCNFPRRVCLEIPDLPMDLAVEAPLRAAQGGPRGGVVLDMPGWGFAWFPLTTANPSEEGKKTAVSASGRKIRNEFLEVEIDAKTGGLRGVWNVRDRYSRIGQQLAHVQGSKSHCTNIEITASGPAFAEIVSQGEIRDANGKKVLARFEQRVRLWTSRPQVELEIHLDPAAPPAGQSLDDSYVCRWAWPDEKTQVLPASGFFLQTSHAADLEAIHLIETRERNLVTDIVTHGLPFHRRGSYRMLDSYLVVPGESKRDFRFSIAFDLAHPWHAVYDSLYPPVWRKVASGPPIPGKTGWLAKLSAANVIATSMTPFNDDTYAAGVRLRFVETEGNMTRSELKFCKVPITSRLTNCRDQLIFDLHVTEEGVPIDLSQFEILQVEALFE